MEIAVNGTPGFHIRAHHGEAHGVGREGLGVEYVELQRHLAISEVTAVKVARLEQHAQARVARIRAEALVIANRTAYLAGFVIAAKRRTCGNAHHGIDLKAVLHPHIEHARGIHAAKAAALEHHANRLGTLARGRREERSRDGFKLVVIFHMHLRHISIASLPRARGGAMRPDTVKPAQGQGVVHNHRMGQQRRQTGRAVSGDNHRRLLPQLRHNRVK